MPANRLLASLSAGDRALLVGLEAVFLAKGEVLSVIEQPMTHFHFMERGLVTMITTCAAGRRVSTGSIGVDGVVGLSSIFAADEAVADYVVQLAGQGYRIPRERLRTAIRRSSSLLRLFRNYAHLAAKLNHLNAACNRLHSVSQRKARWLLCASHDVESNDIPVTQAELAMLLGVSRQAVVAAGTQFVRAGMIEHPATGVIRVLDRPALAQASCECGGLEAAWFDRLFAPEVD